MGTPRPGDASLFGMDTQDWRGFFFGLTGVLALALGMSAALLATLGH